MPKIFEREMTITHQEFLRLLPKAVKGKPQRITGNDIFIEDGVKTVKITLSDESIRKIGALSLSVTHVRIELHGFTDGEDEIFFKSFDLAFQKGGG